MFNIHIIVYLNEENRKKEYIDWYNHTDNFIT